MVTLYIQTKQKTSLCVHLILKEDKIIRMRFTFKKYSADEKVI